MVRRVLPALAACVFAACEATAPLRGFSNEAVVYVVLSPGPSVTHYAPADSALHAIVATVGDTRSGYWRSVEEFTMRRRSDGAVFDWIIVPRVGAVDMTRLGRLDEDPGAWNVHLAWNGTGGRLGRRDLSRGETYDLVIRADGAYITGSTTIPGALTLHMTSTGNHHEATWDSVSNAAYFFLEHAVSRRYHWIADQHRTWEITSPADSVRDFAEWVLIRSFEPQLTATALSDRVRSSGIIGAFGTYGAFTIDSFYVPAYQSESAINSASALPSTIVSTATVGSSSNRLGPAAPGLMISRPSTRSIRCWWVCP